MTFALALLAVLALGQADRPDRVLYSFASEDDLKAVAVNSTKVSLVPDAKAGKALRVEFQPADWPNALWRTTTPWDWEDATGLLLDISNPTSEPQEFGIRVDDDPAADGVTHCRSGLQTLEAGKSATFCLPLGGLDPMAYGMRGLPRDTRARLISANGTIDAHRVFAFQVYQHSPKAPRALVLDNLRLSFGKPRMDGMVDPYGQYTRATWPGKVTKDEDLIQRRKSEEADLTKSPELPDRDRFGGWARGPKLEATGFFRTHKEKGKWWLVDPDGRLFLSLGIDCIGEGDPTVTTGRESMFTWLPKPGDPLAGHVGHAAGLHMGPRKEGDTFNPYSANLQRKYGAEYKQQWPAMALSRLRSWGFNTVGNWSDGGLYRNGRVPYVATTGVGGDHATLASGSDYWGRMPDPFDPKFAEHAAAMARDIAARVKDDPWCLGIFVDNELSWAGQGEDGGRYGLAYGALAEGPNSPGKQAFLEQLRARYSDVARLNEAWGTSFADWEALQKPVKLTGTLQPKQREDFSAFVKSLAHRYFQVVRDALRREDPNHLYLGCRFAWAGPEAIEAANELCEVVSFNIYQARVSGDYAARMAKLDKPCIIGEFHFGALDRGMFHTGLVSTDSQKERASTYVDYLHSVLDAPTLVGCHWFQYIDQPLTGRAWDGENYNIGFVSVTDTPYPEMVAAARKVHAEAYTRRYGSGG
ncbi:MAG TPA: beta-galactosidase [Armatimonadota bacterium]|jgi:hypothetical protein